MLTPQLERTRDLDEVRGWSLKYCGPEPREPDAAAMRTRTFEGPPTELEAGPLRMTQQVAAFETVDAAVAEAAILVEGAEACERQDVGAGRQLRELPVGVQSRLLVFGEGGYFSIGGFFRRGNAVAVVQGEGGEADSVVRDALGETFDRMCVYDRPEGC